MDVGVGQLWVLHLVVGDVEGGGVGGAGCFVGESSW